MKTELEDVKHVTGWIWNHQDLDPTLYAQKFPGHLQECIFNSVYQFTKGVITNEEMSVTLTLTL